LRVVGNKVFVAQAEDGVKIVDMSAAAGPTLVFSTDTPGTAVDLAVANGYVFVADSLFGVQVIKADTGSLLANIETKATVDHIAADDAHVYVREGYNDVVYYELGSGFYKEVNRIKRAQPDILRALNGFLYVGDSIGGIYAYNTKLFGKPESSPVFADANHSVISINPLKNSRLYTTLRTTGNTLNEINGVRILDVGRAKAVSIAGNDFSKGLAFDTAVISDVALPPIAYSLEKDAFGSNYINVINFTNGVKPMQSSVVADGSVMSMSLDGETLYTLNNITSMSSASPGGNMAGGVFAYDVSTPTHIKLINKIQWSGSAYYGGLAAYKDKIITADFSGLRIFDKTQLMTNGAAVTLNDAYLTGMNNDIVMYGDLAIIAQSTGIITYDFATASNLRTDIYKQAQLSFNDEIKRLSVLTGGRVLATQNSGAYSILDVQQGGNLSIVAGLNFDNAITSASVVNDKFYFVDKSGSVNMVDVTPPVLAPRFAQSDVKAGMQLNYSVSWVDYHDAVDTICKVSVGSCTVLRDGKKTNAAILEWQLPTDAIDMNIALRFVVGNGAHFNSAVTYLSVP
ncbi:MAG: hypothetical protein OEW08_12710, partial [Gammaproteobacteria bacterium]|nr:hypothetical protein [Gammaproteobacteria bacterium]